MEETYNQDGLIYNRTKEVAKRPDLQGHGALRRSGKCRAPGSQVKQQVERLAHSSRLIGSAH